MTLEHNGPTTPAIIFSFLKKKLKSERNRKIDFVVYPGVLYGSIIDLTILICKILKRNKEIFPR